MTEVLRGLTPVLRLAQLGSGVYGLWLSGRAVRKLQGYDWISRQAAKWSSTAASDLAETQKTQALGIVSSLVNLASTAYLMYLSASTGGTFAGLVPSGRGDAGVGVVGVAVVNVVVAGAAWFVMQAYWKRTAREEKEKADGSKVERTKDQGLARYIAPDSMKDLPGIGDYMAAWSTTRTLVTLKLVEVGLWVATLATASGL
ncbi:hypothetical protein PYCC9005_003077 [Savitreella phatthalungensis]